MEEALLWILDRLHNIGLSPDAESLAVGLLCGERSLMSPEVLHDMRDAGMSHLLAVSGLHIGLLWGMLQRMVRPISLIPYFFGWNELPWFRAQRWLVVFVLWAYVWLIGFPPSAVRAALMLTIVQISSEFLIGSWSLENLIITALLMLCYDPMQIANVGFQLSFAATAGILVLHPLYEQQPEPSWAKRRRKWWNRLQPVQNLLWLTFSAQLFTIPLCAYYFHHLPLLGWIQGLVVVPVLPLLICSFVVLLLFPASWGMMSVGEANLYHWLALPAEVLVWWVRQVAHYVSQLELWLVGGRVEFYPSVGETILLELILVGLTWSVLHQKK